MMNTLILNQRGYGSIDAHVLQVMFVFTLISCLHTNTGNVKAMCLLCKLASRKLGPKLYFLLQRFFSIEVCQYNINTLLSEYYIHL